MYACLTTSKVHDIDAAAESHRVDSLPKVRQAPGFVSGVWLRLGEDQVQGVTVFETKEQAQFFASKVPELAPPQVTVMDVRVCEVAATA